ncbi:MAG TPA: heparan-alpha-glucosaminide N-acetyltransferase [Casimicrobiaceae bacterium]|nr:heparan-alpha-glucosaminide N-acetyltransferase [Casimicrobiaceae bacterium]
MPALDTLRGIAIVAMATYHLCFDLRYFGFLRADLEYDWRWIAARTLILSTFLLVAGASMVLADRDRQSAPRRWLAHAGVIAAAALAVSAGSFLMFPQTWIWFGVLHAIAASLVIARPFVRRPAIAIAAGVAIIVAGLAFQSAAFDNRALGWLGFMTAKPATEDYVPLFPWTGVLLLGTGLGHLLVRTRFAVLAPLEHAPRLLALLGRHSLAVYLLHQPILIGALWAFVKIRAA